MLRYENVYDELKNLFAYYHDESFQKEIFLFVCGYQDNRIRIFDLAQKEPTGPVMTVSGHSARVTCFRFSKDYKFLYTCDASGVIHHY